MESCGSIQVETMRSEVYRILSTCFYLPDKRMFEREHVLDKLETSLKTLGGGAADSPRRMREGLAAASQEELSVEFSRLFVGPFELPAPPYGSVYLDPNRMVMGDSTMKALRAYKEAGLDLSNGLREPPDHIAVELEFMHYLASREARATADGDKDRARDLLKAQGRFLKESMGPWIPPFCEKMRQGTENAFYRALADCVSAFTEKDERYLNSLMKETSEQRIK